MKGHVEKCFDSVYRIGSLMDYLDGSDGAPPVLCIGNGREVLSSRSTVLACGAGMKIALNQSIAA
jgi:hypothetical protein